MTKTTKIATSTAVLGLAMIIIPSVAYEQFTGEIGLLISMLLGGTGGIMLSISLIALHFQKLMADDERRWQALMAEDERKWQAEKASWKTYR